MKTTLRRYTELPYVIDLLQTKELVLVDPQMWDDRNDSYYIEQYARVSGLVATYALCLAEASETYHHWRVFSHGSGGVCIHFDKEKLLKNAKNVKGLRAEEVRYKTISELSKIPPHLDELPFLKRYAYVDEKEFRFFFGTEKKEATLFRVPITLSAIEKITLSPWLPRTVCQNVKIALRSIKGCSNLCIHRSTLVENENWKKFAENGTYP